MALLYADEGFPKKVSELLSSLGHDVLTVQAAGNANQGIPDSDVLAFAIQQGRAVLTVNRADFIKLHKQNARHHGIIVCTENKDRHQLACRIDAAILEVSDIREKLIRVNRPA